MDQNRIFDLYRANRRRYQIWQRIVAILSCFVVVLTLIPLTLPSFAMERGCGISEHTHTDSCYTRLTEVEQATLTCAYTPHTHTDACGENCGMADFAVHSHEEICYSDGELVCPLPQILPHTHEESCYAPAHTHGEDCYVTVLGALICEETPRDAHTHDETCYALLPICEPEDPETHEHSEECFAEVLICSREETQGHEHGESCFVPLDSLICPEDDQALVLTCGLEKILLHTHEDACFAQQEGVRTLICPLPEVTRHIHTDDCITVTTIPADTTVLTCQQEEHIHSDECGPEAERETTSPSTEPIETTAETTAPATEPTETTAPATDPTQAAGETEPDPFPGASTFVFRPTTVIASGTFQSTEGNELSWELLENTLTGDRTLYVDGEGTMPAFTSGTAPWYGQRSVKMALVLGDGLLNVGSYAFSAMPITSITWGEKIASIDSYAFHGNGYLTAVSIPAPVHTVSSYAFYKNTGLRSITLNEGLQTVGSYAFHQNGNVGSQVISIPNTLTSLGDLAFPSAHAYAVAEDHPLYCAVDGILYTKDMTSLVDYPKQRTASEYRVPSSVTTIQSAALQGVTVNTPKLYVPSSVQSTTQTFCRGSAFREVYIEDGAMIGNKGKIWSCFTYNTNLQYVRLPSDIPLSFGDTFSGCRNLLHLDIPAGTSWLATPGSGMTNLRTLYYNARNSGMQDRGMLEGSYFDLTIGKDVDRLSYVFHEFTGKSRSIRFEGPNHITIEVGKKDQAFQDAPAPFKDLSGTLYIDAQGVVYILDEAALTATVFCVQPSATAVTIPTTVPTTDGTGVCAVVAVHQDALKYAGNLSNITFADPTVLTSLDALAMANCPALTSVCSETTVEGATALFPNATIGYNLFYNTGLTGAPGTGIFSSEMQGVTELTVIAENATELTVTAAGENMQWDANEDGTGGYRMLTGQTVTFTAAVGNTEENQQNRYRVYFRSTSSDADYSIVPGTQEAFNGWAVSYHATDDPYTIYMEFGTPPEGNTSGLPVIVSYPNIICSGGGLTVWGTIVDADAQPGTIIEASSPENTIQISWGTAADDFAIAKVPTQTGTIGVISDSNGGAKPAANPGWRITLTRDAENSSPYGKDHAQGADFVDTFLLPKGIQWRQEVLTALENGTVTVSGGQLFAGSLCFAEIGVSGSGLHVSNRSAALVDGNVVFRWNVVTNNASSEMSTVTTTMNIFANALKIDPATFDTTTPAQFQNQVSATVHYTYRDDAAWSVDPETGEITNPQLFATASRNISGGKGELVLQKTRSEADYFGEDVTYTLRLYNNGALPWVSPEESALACHTLRDVLPREAYLTPENMQRMFAEHPDLTITVNDAVLGTWQSSTGTDGSSVWLHPGNTAMGTDKQTLTITAGDAGYTVAVTGGGSYTSASLAQAFQSAGYAPTSADRYTCVWPLHAIGTKFILSSGENRYFYVYATFKDTFQMLTADWLSEYNGAKAVNVTNYAYVMYPTGNRWVRQTNATNSIRRDASIGKHVTRNGNSLPSGYAVNDGDVLDYQLTFSHYGNGSHGTLPFVDDLYGSQYLLVPIQSNPSLAGLETHGDHYILAPGEYENVVVGMDDEGRMLIAASVTVSDPQEDGSFDRDGIKYSFSGLHTRIQWNFPSMESGFYQMQVNYQSLVDLDLTGVNYSVGNLITLNDRPGSRLYHALWGGGSLLKFEQDIVTEAAEDPADDSLDEDKHTLINPGEEVLYRATITNNLAAPVFLAGPKMAIALPDTMGIFDWELGTNVTNIRIVGEDGTVLTNLDQAYLGSSYTGVIGERQYILWPENAGITFGEFSSVYIYYTLTYPQDTDPMARAVSVWDQYAEALRGNPLENDFYVYRFPSTVSHDLNEPGAVLLQKGVFDTFHYSGRNAIYSCRTRLFYNNRDARNRAAVYYVLLYNGGNKRMYLNDLTDQLPEGFSFLTMAYSDGTIPTNNMLSISTVSGSSHLTRTDADMTFRSATVTADTADGLTFRIGAGSGINALRYDDQREQYYLERGEAIEFAFACGIGLASTTRDAATNRISMAYTDHLNTGTLVLMPEDVFAGAAESINCPDENDGNRLSETTGDGILLSSEVTLYRGGIIPGVTKYTDSYQADAQSSPVPYTNQVTHNAIVNWRVRLHNSGTLSMIDYTMMDAMPYPYTFTGTVSYTLFGMGVTEASPVNLISIPNHTPTPGTPVAVTDLLSVPQTERAVVINGAPVAFGRENFEFYVSLGIDDSGNEVLTIRFAGLHMSIYEGGYMDVTLSSVNNTGIYTYSVYTNQAALIPSQEFTAVSQGSMIRDDDGIPYGARNASAVTVSIGYATSSQKSVTQDDRQAVSGAGEGNFIVLSEDSNEVDYDLTVRNDTDRAMTRLVLIDNLPQVGDHNPFDVNTRRNSEFTVSLAEDPAFSVMIQPENGAPYPAENYQIQFSKGTDFGGPQSAHWKGEAIPQDDPTVWTNDPSGARSIRVILWEQIPSKATVTVTFRAEVPTDLPPGLTAWNSFGYHYALEGQTVELEAMPHAVGVKVPGVPSLTKRILDPEGDPIGALKDATFTFVLYEGSPVADPLTSAAQLTQSLTAANRAYRVLTLPVAAGSTASQPLVLDFADWNWQSGKTYTLAEIRDSDAYDFHRFLGTTAGQYTFSYDPARQQEIFCENIRRYWSVELTKVDPLEAPLAGAQFALYSPRAADRLAQEIPGVPGEVTFNGATWYLVRRGTSGEDGKILWEELVRDCYYLLEIQPPPGYEFPETPGRILYRSAASDGIYTLRLTNTPGYELPKTGAVGWESLALTGLLLMAAAVFLFLQSLRKRPK